MSTASFEARSPPACPPSPSATASTPWCGLQGRTAATSSLGVDFCGERVENTAAMPPAISSVITSVISPSATTRLCTCARNLRCGTGIARSGATGVRVAPMVRSGQTPSEFRDAMSRQRATAGKISGETRGFPHQIIEDGPGITNAIDRLPLFLPPRAAHLTTSPPTRYGKYRENCAMGQDFTGFCRRNRLSEPNSRSGAQPARRKERSSSVTRSIALWYRIASMSRSKPVRT